jgi:signal transduction histidine kinase
MDSKTTILYIDDEEENLLGFKSSYSRLFSIATASSQNLALTLLQSNSSIGVVLVDYKMPGKDGIQFVNEIRDDYPDLIFIIISAWADVDIVIKAMNLNIFYGFIQKPWNFAELQITLKNAIAFYQSQIENKRLNTILIAKNRELEESYLREKEANNVKNVFLQNISHEIRTPLNSIIGFSYLIKNQSEDKKAHIFADFINQSGYQLLQTIQDILEVSLILCNQYESKSSEFSLHSLINNIIVEYMDEIENKNLSATNLVSNNIMVEADMPKVHRIISAIMSNAIKFTERGSIEICCNENQVNDQLVISVKDTGIGIANDKLEQIFHPFRQADESFSRRFGGNGIGLFIAKSYAEFLGEDIWVESNVNQGSTFHISLKRKPQVTFSNNYNLKIEAENSSQQAV